MVDKVRLIKRIVGEKYFSDDIELDRGRCNGIRHTRITCDRCAQICPAGALEVQRRDILIDVEKCTHCGACITVCPTQALFSAWLPWGDLVKNALKAVDVSGARPIVACPKVLDGDYDHTKVVELPCLERVDEALLMAMAAGGASKIRLVCGDCLTCDVGCMGAVWTLVAEHVREMLAAVGCATAGHATTGCATMERTEVGFATMERTAGIEVLHELPADAFEIANAGLSNGEISRRDLFTGFKDEAKSAAGIAFDEAMADSKYAAVASLLGVGGVGGAGAGDVAAALDEAWRGRICEWAMGTLALRNLGASGEARPADVAGSGGAAGADGAGKGASSNPAASEPAPAETVEQRARRAVEALGDARISSRIFSNIEIDDEKCISCFLCEAYCKNHAIEKLRDEHKVAGFRITPSRCVQCDVCLDMCRAGALTLTRQVRVADILTEAAYEITYEQWEQQAASTL